MVTGLNIDGTFYRCRVTFPSMNRSFTVLDGGQGGTTLSGATIRDILGVAYSYTMTIQPDPAFPDDYDLLYQVLSSEQDSHIVSFPFAQRAIIFEAMITAGTDNYDGKRGGVQRWKDLSVTFTPIEPQGDSVVVIPSISFYIDPEDGNLYQVTTPNYTGADFSLSGGGYLEVTT